MVLSGNDGCVVARSNEVKALGIKMGTPLYQIEGLVRKHGITCFSSNFALYGDLSDRVMSLLRSHTTRFEQYSIDEGFILLDHVPEAERKAYCERIVREIYQGVGIPVSMGIAPSKTLCKVAADYAKHYPGYRGACAIDNEAKRLKALASYPIEDVWGIGRKANAKLQAARITTALQFANKSATFAQNLLHKPGRLTWEELNGKDSIRVEELIGKQSITNSRTFATAVTSLALMEQQIANFCDSCARKLRAQHSVTTEAHVFCATSRFQTAVQDLVSLRVIFPFPTSSTREMIDHIFRALRPRFVEGIPYKQAGVTLTHIQPESSVVADLFDDRDRAKESRLQQAMDSIREHNGRSAIMLGSQLPTNDPNQPTLFKSDHHSPLYTTDIHQLLRIKA